MGTSQHMRVAPNQAVVPSLLQYSMGMPSQQVHASVQPHFQQPVMRQHSLYAQAVPGQQPSFEQLMAVQQSASGSADTETSSRPFTSMLDKLIADEKSRSPGNSLPRSSAKLIEPESSATTGKRLLFTGPLSEPVLSSTQRSELDELEQISSIPPDKFRPLHSSPFSQFEEYLSEDHTRHVCAQKAQEKVTFEVRPRGVQQNIDQLNDQEFLQYYKRLQPEERKRQLLHQKEALLAEQQRLQHILAQQENLLIAKQAQLHQQQEMQRRRLMYFERTGCFPAADWDGTMPPYQHSEYDQGVRS